MEKSIIRNKSWDRNRETFSEYEKLTIWEKFCQVSEKFCSNNFLCDSEAAYTYSEVKILAEKAAFYLKTVLKLKKGDFVLFQLENSNWFSILFLAMQKSGIIPVMLVPALGYQEILSISKQLCVKAYITSYCVTALDKGFYVGIDKNNVFTNIESVINFEKIKTFVLSCKNYENPQEEKIYSYENCVLLLSGGTSGVPKLINRTHEDYLYNSLLAAQRCNITTEDVYFAVLPLAHNFPLACPGLLGIMQKGAQFVSGKCPGPVEFFDFIQQFQVTITAVVPSLAELYLEFYAFLKDEPLPLKKLLIGGGMLLPEVASKVIKEFGCKLIQVFGTAEGLICTTSENDSPDTVINTQGKPLSNYDCLYIVDENDEICERGVEGELITSGPYTINSYFMRPDLQSSSFTKDGFYRTGDKAVITKDGNLQIRGRIKEQINCMGEKIMPAQVENIILKNKKVKECVVAGIPDKVLGNRICAFVILEKDETLTLEELKAFMKANGANSYYLPHLLKVLQYWPLTAVKKIDKKQLVKMVDQNE